jgi:hypothetical protein
MVAWETMALASFFLVTTEHRIPEIRRAGFLYLLIAHIGAIAILLCFGVLQGGSGDYTFDVDARVDAAGAWPTARSSSRSRLRRQGGPPAAARLAARGASGGAVARLGADERRDAQDGDLRLLRVTFDPVHTPSLVVGCRRPLGCNRASRRRVRRRS